MVATRTELAEKLARRAAPAQLIYPTTTSARIPPAERSTTTVNGYVVLTIGRTARATPMGASAIIDIYPPGDCTHEQAHDLAVRFLRRRGPDYAPSGSRVIVTLDQRGRQRHIDRF